ncbi:MAG TPA: NAD(P)-dependent oxidoreductase [Gemmatimonadaceae bacterium]|nr:NAD(P)-dependent oxidoreductase [Gemmatimonadaceae bacterium]
MNKSVLVIGGAGYIGPVVIDRLLAAGSKVTCLDLLLYENDTSVTPFLGDPNYQFVYGDLRDERILRRAMRGVTDVILLAGLVGDPITKKYPEASRQINDDGIIGCIDYFNRKGLDRVVFVSTCSNYGLINSDELADENFPLNPLSPYAKSKVAAEQHLLAGRGTVDYTPSVLRFATAFGLAPRMRFDLTVNEFTRELALGRELLVFDAHTWRPYCHVKDFARLIQQVIEAPSDAVAFEVFNAGGEINNFTKQGIVDAILKVLPDSNVRYQQQGADPRNYRVDFHKVRETLGFEPEYTIEDGINELLAAIREHVFERADLKRNFHGNYEIEYPRP